MKKIIVFLFIFLFFSCYKNYSIYSECINSIKALEEWQSIEDFDFYISQRKHSANLKIYKWQKTGGILGAYYGDGNIKSIDDFVIVSHEIGHFLGYKHSLNKKSVMYNAPQYGNFIDLIKE